MVSEDEIMDSLDIIINKLKIVVEPSSASKENSYDSIINHWKNCFNTSAEYPDFIKNKSLITSKQSKKVLLMLL